MVLVVAPTYERYRTYVESHMLDPWTTRYISRPSQLLGYRNTEVVYLGAPSTLNAVDFDKLHGRIELARR